MAVKVCLPFIRAAGFDKLRPNIKSNLVECAVNAIDQLIGQGQQELAATYFRELPQNCFSVLKDEFLAKAKNLPARLGILENSDLKASAALGI